VHQFSDVPGVKQLAFFHSVSEGLRVQVCFELILELQKSDNLSIGALLSF
jgi:hypothetical protein